MPPRDDVFSDGPEPIRDYVAHLRAKGLDDAAICDALELEARGIDGTDVVMLGVARTARRRLVSVSERVSLAESAVNPVKPARRRGKRSASPGVTALFEAWTMFLNRAKKSLPTTQPTPMQMIKTLREFAEEQEPDRDWSLIDEDNTAQYELMQVALDVLYRRD